MMYNMDLRPSALMVNIHFQHQMYGKVSDTIPWNRDVRTFPGSRLISLS